MSLKRNDIDLVILRIFGYLRSILSIDIDLGEIKELADHIWDGIKKDQEIEKEIEQVYIVTRQDVIKLMTKGFDTFYDIHGNKIVLQMEDDTEPPSILENGTIFICKENLLDLEKKNNRHSSDKNADENEFLERQKCLDEFNKPSSDKKTEEMIVKGDKENIKMIIEHQETVNSENREDQNLLADYFGKMSINYVNKGEYETAIKYAKKKLTIVKNFNDKLKIAKCYNFIGEIYSIIEEKNTNALKYFKKEMLLRKELLSTAQKQGDRYEMAKQYIEIGSFYQYGTNEDHIALRYYKKALIIFNDLEAKCDLAQCLDRMSTIYSDTKKNVIALKYKQRELAIYRDLGEKNNMYPIYVTIGEMYFEGGKLETAIQYFKEALVIHKELGIQKKISSMFKLFGHLYKDLKDLDIAQEYFEKARLLRSLESS